MISRQDIYYWKCDRESAFTNDSLISNETSSLEAFISSLLQEYFGDRSFSVRSAGGQGNHMTFIVEHQQKKYFLRLENGPENDVNMEVEAHILNKVRDVGVPTPKIYKVDASRTEVSFAYQIMEFMDYADLNSIYNETSLKLYRLAENIGSYMAEWQSIRPKGFGPFNAGILRKNDKLEGFHESYHDYYFLNLQKHLDYLVLHNFFSEKEACCVLEVIRENTEYLNLEQGCLVHKDLALWNILGDEKHIGAIIDWDDSISGDPMDDISLMACFHSKEIVYAILKGYQNVRPLPDNYIQRFWLHLLRNMIVKAVIRVGGGYFYKENNFFLIGDWLDNMSLEEFTKKRINIALEGLKEGKSLEIL